MTVPVGVHLMVITSDHFEYESTRTSGGSSKVETSVRSRSLSLRSHEILMIRVALPAVYATTSDTVQFERNRFTKTDFLEFFADHLGGKTSFGLVRMWLN